MILLLAAAAAPLAAQTPASPALWAGLPAGPSAVGYRVAEPASGTVHLWYPASSARGAPMSVRAYAAGGDSALAAFLRSTGLSPVTVNAFLDSPLLARRDAPRAAGVAPLVLMAQGNAQDAPDQAVLAELLASHGFVVATTPSPMRATPLESEAQVPGLAERQADDLAAAISAAAALAGADTTRMSIVGHSFGARAMLLLAMRRSGFRCLVSLDGGIGTTTADSVFRTAPSFNVQAPLPRLLHLYEELDAFMRPEHSLLRSLRTPGLTLASIPAMRHVHFTVYGFAASVFPDIAALTRADAATGASVADVANRTVAFVLEHGR